MIDRIPTRGSASGSRLTPFARAVTLVMAAILAHGAPLFPTLAAHPNGSGAAVAPKAAGLEIEKVLPSGTIAYFSISDIGRTFESFKGTALYDIWADKQVQKFLEKPMQMMTAHSAEFEKHVAGMGGTASKGMTIERIASAFGGDIAVGLARLKMPEGGPTRENPPNVGAFLTFKIGDESAVDALVGMIETLAKTSTDSFVREPAMIAGVSGERMGPKDEPTKLYVAKAAGHIVLSFDETTAGAIVSALSGKSSGSALGSDANYSALAKSARRPGEVASFYANLGALFASLDPVLPPQAKAAIDALGMNGLQSIMMSSSIEGRGFVDVSAVHTSGEPKGIVKAFSGSPIDSAVVDSIPKDVVSFSVFSFDAGCVWNTLWDTIRAVDASKEKEARDMLAQFESQVGVKLKEDVIDQIGSRVVIYQRPQQPGQMIPDIVFQMQVKGAEKLGVSMEKLTKLAPNLALKNVKIAENTYYYLDLSAIFPLPFFQPSYAFVGDSLVFSPTLQSLKSVVNSRKSPTFESVRANEEFKSFLAKIPQSVTSLSYTDVKKSFGGGYDQIRQMLPLLAMQFGSEMPVDLALLPTSDAFTRHLYGSYSYSEQKGADGTTVAVGPMSTLFLIGVFAVAGAAGALIMGRARSAQVDAERTERVDAEKKKDAEEEDEDGDEDEDDDEPR